jgi:DNA-directed RNA polymerase II subunit RPB1
VFSVLPISPPCIRPRAEFCDSEELRGQSELTKTLDRICKTSENLRKHASEVQEHFEFLVEHRYKWPGSWMILPLYLYLTELDTYWLSRLGSHYYTKFRGRSKKGPKTQEDAEEDTRTEAAKQPPTFAQLQQREHDLRVALREFEFVFGHLYDQVSNMFASPSKSTKQGQRGNYQNNGTSFRDRLGSKGGLLRKYITAKRRVRSGRAVISPDHEAHIAWAGVPEQMATTLTYTETVTEFNLHRLTRMVHNGPYKYPGANFVITPTDKGEETIDLRFVQDHAQVVLQPGFKVERHALTGDPALFNRQPSLHRMNIQMMFISVSNKFKVLKIALPATPPMAADFDGDEMTYHALNDEDARADSLLMLSEFHIASPKNGYAIYAPVFDSALGPTLMSEAHIMFDMQTAHGFLAKLNPALLPPGRSFDDCIALLHNFDAQRRQRVAEVLDRASQEHISVAESDMPVDSDSDLPFHLFPVNRIPGQLVLSCILPATLTMDLDKAKIVEGRLHGPLTRSCLLAILGVIFRMYGSRDSSNFLYNLQVFANEFLSFHGCSLGPDDFQLSAKTQEDTESLVRRAMAWIDARGPPQTEEDEAALQEILNALRDRCGKLALKELMEKARVTRNGALECVRTGTKGTNSTVIESATMIGQLFKDCKRLTGKLPVFHDDELKTNYAQKTGFIAANYYKGLSAIQFFFSAMASRQGQTDTATKTCNTGYIARKLVKGLEGITIDFAGYVRASNGDLISLAFGGDSFDGMYVLKVPLRILSMSQDTVVSEFRVLNEPGVSELVLSDLMALRKVFLEACVCENRSDNLVVGLGPMEPIAALAKQGLKKNSDNSDNSENTEKPLTPLEIYTRVKDVMEKQILSQHRVPPLAFMATVLENFTPAKLAGATATSLATALETLLSLHSRALVQARTQVGIIAGQSVGEPTTQLTLQSSHNIGHKVNLGVSRVNEIICAQPTEKMGTPVMDFYVDVQSRAACERICRQVRGSIFQQFVLHAETSLEDSFQNPSPEKSAQLARETLLGKVTRSLMNQSPTMQNMSVLRFQIDLAKCASHSLSPALLADKILFNVFGKKSEVTLVMDRDIIRFEFAACDKVMLDALKKLQQQQRPKKLENMVQDEIKQNGPPLQPDAGFVEVDADPVRNELKFPLDMLKHRVLQGTVVAGVNRIKSTHIDQVKVLDCEQTLQFGLNDSRSCKQRLRVHTTGSDLNFVINLATRVPEIDWTTCVTNSIREVQKTLGIAAATMWIGQQLQEVLSSNGSRVHSRYTMLVAQAMTKDGTVQAFGRYGVIKQQRSVLARAGFELAVKVLMEGAMTAEVDNLTGITEAVITGQKPRIGTAQVELFDAKTTLFDLWKLQPVFRRNAEIVRKRRVLGPTTAQLSDSDLDLIRCVTKCETRVDLTDPGKNRSWRLRRPDWGKYPPQVLRFATSREDVERLYQLSCGTKEKRRSYGFSLAQMLDS